MNNPKSSPSEMKGAILSAEHGPEKAILDLLKRSLDKQCFDAIIMPVKVPAGDSFTYLLIQDQSLLNEASPLPPIMFVQGAKAISSITRYGKGNLRIAAIMHPCEICATIELAKLEQVNLENMILISIDCPGVLPMSDFLTDPEKGMEIYRTAMQKRDDGPMRPVCQICDKFGMIAGDLHIGILGAEEGNIFIIPNSPSGKNILDCLGISSEESVKSWHAKVSELTEKRRNKKEQVYEKLKSEISGLDNLLDAFSQCINCHNCMRVCPICYCQQCYFDSENVKHPPEDYLQRAESSGCLRFPPDPLLFHAGRMMHMSLSCVSCGCCEDACPVSIPVAQIYSMIAQKTQELFNYTPGEDLKEPHPLATFREEEFEEFED